MKSWCGLAAAPTVTGRTLIGAVAIGAALIGAPLVGTPANAAAPNPPTPAKAAAKAPAPVSPVPAAPDSSGSGPRDEGTLEVTADRDLEWLQQDHAYIARGNAVAKRGAVTMMGDTLIAYYRPLAGTTPAPAAAGAAKTASQSGIDSSNTEIWRVVAVGHVHILSGDRDAYGDRAEYDKDKSVFVLTGKALKASSLTDVVTARDTLEYWQDKDMAVARGNALVVRVNGNTLAGDVIAGHFVKDEHGQTALKTISAKGHVVVTTLTDVVHGDEGTYDIDTQRTMLFGNVKATRGQSELEGQSAEVNMQTGISQVFPGPGQQVHALFVRQNAASQSGSTGAASGVAH